MPRAIRVAQKYKEEVKMALLRNGFSTQRAFAEEMKLALSTVNNFLNCRPVYNLNFVEICHYLELDWQKIADLKYQNETISSSSLEVRPKLEPIPPGKGRLFLELKASIEEIDKELLDNIVTFLQQRSADVSLTLRRLQEGSLVLVFQGTQEGCSRIEPLFKSGQLTEVLGIPVENVRVESAMEAGMEATAPTPYHTAVNLLQWLQNNFVEASRANWLPIKEVFRTRTLSPAFRSTVKRAKQIDLGTHTVALVIQLSFADNQEIGVLLGLYPTDNQTYLPEKLNLTIFSASGELLIEILIPSPSENFVQELFFTQGEQFYIQVFLGDIIYTEDFVI